MIPKSYMPLPFVVSELREVSSPTSMLSFGKRGSGESSTCSSSAAPETLLNEEDCVTSPSTAAEASPMILENYGFSPFCKPFELDHRMPKYHQEMTIISRMKSHAIPKIEDF